MSETPRGGDPGIVSPVAGETLLQRIEDGVGDAAQVAVIAGAVTGQPEITALGKLVQVLAGQVAQATSQASQALGTAQQAHAKAQDALDTANNAPVAEDNGSLLQDIVNFLHHLFPGHSGLPGTPKAPEPPPPAA